jgi:hypothetical protein
MKKEQRKIFDKWYCNRKDLSFIKGEDKWIGVNKKQLIRLINRILKIK